MFFLGGFNTILPYILYLFILSAFMFIGFSGRIHAVWHGLFSTPTNNQTIELQHDPAGLYISIMLTMDADDCCEETSVIYNNRQQHSKIFIPEKVFACLTLYLKSNAMRAPPATYITHLICS